MTADIAHADRPRTREPLGRRFHALLASTGLANLADGIVQVGVPLYAVSLTRSPVLIAALSAATWVPWLLLGLLGGAAVDRGDRKHLQVTALLARAALLAAAAAMIATGRGSIALLLALVALYGVTDVVVDLAENALVPDVAPSSRLQAANGRVMAVQLVAATFVGAPIAGWLLGVGAGLVLVVPATLAVGAATVLTLGVAGRYRHAEPDQQGSGSTLARIREGLAVLWRHPALRPLTVAGAVFNMASTGYSALLVLWAVGAGSAIGLTAQQYAWVAVSMAAGAVVGSVASESLVSRVPELRVMLVGWVIAAATLAVPVLWPEPAVMFGAVAVTGLTAASVNVISQSVRQRLVPARTLGRVTGASRTLGYGLMPLGAMSAGVAAQHWGLAPVMLVAAGLTVLIPLVLATRVRSAMLTVPAT
jgi:MFS family permease